VAAGVVLGRPAVGSGTGVRAAAPGVGVRAAGTGEASRLRGLAVAVGAATTGARGAGLTGTLRGTAGFSAICGALNSVAVGCGGRAVGDRSGSGVEVAIAVG
jgi:hypothetical protein